MKKNIFAVLAFLSLFILSGCGSNSKSDGSGEAVQTVAVEMQENQIVLQENGTDFVLPLPFTKKLDSTYHVELSDFALRVNGCTVSDITFSPTSLVLDGGLNTRKMLTINGSFDQNCTPTGYIFTALQTVSQGNKIKHDDVKFSYDYSEEIGEVGYSIINVTTPLNIGEVNTDYAITMQVIKDAYVAAGKTVKLKAFDSRYGTIKTSSTYTVTTDANGIAQFDYLSPATLPTDGTTTALDTIVVDENDTIIAGPQSIVLDFNANHDRTDVTNYQLIAAPNEINVPKAGESKERSLFK